MENENQETTKPVFFYRVPEAAKVISISKSQMWTLIREQIIPTYKVSDKITLIKASELLNYVESFKVERNG